MKEPPEMKELEEQLRAALRQDLARADAGGAEAERREAGRPEAAVAAAADDFAARVAARAVAGDFGGGSGAGPGAGARATPGARSVAGRGRISRPWARPRWAVAAMLVILALGYGGWRRERARAAARRAREAAQLEYALRFTRARLNEISNLALWRALANLPVPANDGGRQSPRS